MSRTVKINEGVITLHDKFSGFLIDYYPNKKNARKNGAVDFCIYIPKKKRIAYYGDKKIVAPFKKYLEENNHEILDIVTTESITLK